MAPESSPVTEPFPISCIAGRYLLFDVDVISYARRTHNITGVLVGTIPNLSQQNIFLGIPLELTPEEARVLVERGNAYLADDVEQHRRDFMGMSRRERLEYLRDLDSQGLDISKEVRDKAEERAEQALKNKGLARKEKSSDEPSSSIRSTPELSVDGSETTLFSSEPSTPVAVAVPEKKLDPTFITPTTSRLPFEKLPVKSASALPAVPKSYPLFRYLHSRGYFTMPGLRFGCNYSVYPGDPLRFHSHFLATGLDWDEEFDLLDIIGGGRLGTGVKKAYLIGGEEPNAAGKGGEERGVVNDPVRAFSVEWAGL